MSLADEPAIFADPGWATPDTSAFADARDRITWQNAAVREAVKTERERIAGMLAGVLIDLLEPEIPHE